MYCTNVEVNVALLYSKKCDQTQRGGGVVFSNYNTHPV